MQIHNKKFYILGEYNSYIAMQIYNFIFKYASFLKDFLL